MTQPSETQERLKQIRGRVSEHALYADPPLWEDIEFLLHRLDRSVLSPEDTELIAGAVPLQSGLLGTRAPVDNQGAETLHRASVAAPPPVFDVLQELSDRFNGVDNGYCTLCNRHRSYDTRGKVQPCSNAECLSHKITAALSGEGVTENSLVNDFISHLGQQLRLTTEELDKLRNGDSPVAATVDAETLDAVADQVNANVARMENSQKIDPETWNLQFGTSDSSIRAAAAEIDDLFDAALQGGRLYADGFNRGEVKLRIAAILSKHLRSAAGGEPHCWH